MSQPDHPSVERLLDRAIEALMGGDRATANKIAGQVLDLDHTNIDAEDLLALPLNQGEIRRLTLMFADLVDSTALSTRIEPEIYRTVVGRYKELVRRVVDRYEGHIASTKGDGLMIVFGHPLAHENDVQRAVQAGLDVAREVAKFSGRVRERFGFDVQVRIGIHRGLVYLDIQQDDVYGLAANMAARVSGLAAPGSVVVSSSIESLIRAHYDLEFRPPQHVKGVDEPVSHYRVLGETDSSARVQRGILIGRETELAYLKDSWNKALSGGLERSGVILRGEAGIGKSRLAGEVAQLAESGHATILELRGSPLHTDVGLRPIRRLIEIRCGITRVSSPMQRLELLSGELDRLGLDRQAMVPLLAPVLGIAPEAGYDVAPLQGRKLYGQIADAIHHYLLACLGQQPALVIAEDVHWFDEDTIDVVKSLLAKNLGTALIVMTARSDVALPQDCAAITFDLDALSNVEADELILALDPRLSPADRKAVRRRCDGVPLYIEEVVAKLKSELSPSSETSRVPDTLYEALFARLRSSRNAAQVVEAAALIGSHVDRSLLHAVVDLTERSLDDVVGELEAGGVLQSTGTDGWQFRHELLREVAAELSPPSVRLRLHGRIADAMAAGAAQGNPDWPSVAGHYEHAERFTEAALAYQQASSDARRRGSVNEARSHLTSAIAQIERAAPGRDRDSIETALRLRRGFLIYAAEGVSSPNAASEFERCLELTGTELSDDLISTLNALYGYYAIRADLGRVHQLLETVRSALQGDREWIRPFNHAGFGMLAWYRGEFRGALETLESAALARNDENARALVPLWYIPNEGTASIYTHLALARFSRGDLPGAEEQLHRTAQRCGEVEFPQGVFSLAYAHHLEFMMRVEAGQLDLAAEIAAELSRIADRHGFDSWSFAGAAQMATAAALRETGGGDAAADRINGHIATLDNFINIWRALGVISLITFYDGVVARLLVAAGRADEARERIDAALALSADKGMRLHDSELLRIRAHTFSDDARRHEGLARAIDLARQQGAVIYELRSAMDDFRLRGEPARASLQNAVDQFRLGDSWPVLTEARTLLG